MKFTLSWLKRHLKTDATIEEVAEAMTLAGLEVEEIIDPAKALSAFTIAHVISAEKHPDADKLQVCQVETVDGPKQIVCGAPNARAGIAVAYAPLGAYIPGLDFALDKKPRKIRGVESSGMMCSGKELEMGDDHDGILELDPSQFPVGQAISDAMGANDPVIDFEVTPNRPDWLGVNSIARDLAAVGLGELITPAIEPVAGTFPCDQEITIEDTDGCPAFVGRIVRGVKNGPSPQWLQDQLKSIGLRPISALVDITNFVTYDRARPLHFYDLNKVQGAIMVRRGKDETFEALDDKLYTASASDIAITDTSGILGLGGIVGGESTGVDENTTDILIESAYFDPLTIRRTAKRLGVNSDAKYRFERGVDTGGLIDGAELATRLVMDICGGEPSDIKVAGEIPATPADVNFNTDLVERLTGLKLSDFAMEKILTDLGFGVVKGETWTVTVPSFRRDAVGGADLVEEIARIHGFHNLEAVSLPPLPGRREPTATLTQNRTRLARRALALQGLSEAITWSFVLEDHAKAFDGGQANLALDNPISNDLNWMRPSALIHLLLAGQRSANQGYPGAALFELGPIFQGTAPDEQSLSLAGMRRVEPSRDWAGAVDITALTAKADVMSALAAMGANTDNLQVMDAVGSYWHPGRSASLRLGPKNVLASFGELHPRALKSLGIDGRVVAFEIAPDNLPAPKKKSASKAKSALTLSDLMPVHRDFAFIVSEDVRSGDILRAAKGADKQLISEVSLFDVYRGKGVDEGHKSLAIDVTLTPKAATLTDADIEAVSSKIIDKVMKAGGRLRG
ncbi:phenylalanine--tRNA ligase beta subunit [Litorimonas cladophorae]|uniref:Phenylalanine--tRNA ligase beta subunit n=1 Tax=Litorimonas cladophorae TaxID=1220491 RepID=A0A918NGH3_9PROT|nr:phenylalanine--tRNA ligase subunit beta [Litorimonas cladophorae]GGX65801.1 phenylalanine--tRNA ligase beta subunit [Litorimonas cladophorae]